MSRKIKVTPTANKKPCKAAEPECEQVNHPLHYQSRVADLKIEALDCMRAAYGDEAVSAFCLCNSLKYVYRCKAKGGNKSIQKAIWYLDKYLELNKKEENA